MNEHLTAERSLAGLLIRDSLLLRGKPVRADLRYLAEGVLGRLSSLAPEPKSEADLRHLAELTNLGSLILLNSGEGDLAALLCSSFFDRLVQLSSPSNRTVALMVSIQPWINLGRLRARDGNFTAGLEHARIAYSYALKESIYIGPACIKAEDWAGILLCEPRVSNLLWNVAAHDAPRIFLRLGDYDRAAAEARRCLRVAPKEAWPQALEVLVVSALGSDEPELAAELCVDVNYDWINRGAFALLSSTAYLGMGRRTLAEQMLLKFVDGLRLIWPIGVTTLVLRQMRYSAELAQVLGLIDLALRLNREALFYLQSVQDEPLTWEFLRHCLQIAPEHVEASSWAFDLSRLEARSMYDGIRPRMSPSTLLDESFSLDKMQQRLFEFLRTR